MVAFSTTFILVQTIHQPVRMFDITGYWSCYGEQNASYHVKEQRKLYQTQVSKATLYFVLGHLSRNKKCNVDNISLGEWFCLRVNSNQLWTNKPLMNHKTPNTLKVSAKLLKIMYHQRIIWTLWCSACWRISWSFWRRFFGIPMFLTNLQEEFWFMYF